MAPNSPISEAPRLVYIVTVPMSARYHLRGHLTHMREHGYDVTVISSPGPELDLVAEREGVRTMAVPMAREVEPISDLASLWRLYRAIRSIRPHVVNAGTPKAGLLGMIAARLARVPIRIYVLRGLRAETTSGLWRAILAVAERVASECAHRVVCVSRSLAEVFVRDSLAPASKIVVLGGGSGNGVNAARFAPGSIDSAELDALRTSLGIGGDDPVIGFVGRFTRDKGVAELARAFRIVRASHPTCKLLLVGDFESGDPVPEETRRDIVTQPGVILAGSVPDAAPYYHLMRVLAFPSYREGFPNVPLEAAAAGVPCVGFAATGTVDAVQHGLTGLLVRAGDTSALADGLTRLLSNERLRNELGSAARDRVVRHFQPEHVWENWLSFYQKLEGRRP